MEQQIADGEFKAECLSVLTTSEDTPKIVATKLGRLGPMKGAGIIFGDITSPSDRLTGSFHSGSAWRIVA